MNRIILLRVAVRLGPVLSLATVAPDLHPQDHESWSLAPEASVRLGGEEAPLYGVEGAVVMSDGRFVVSNRDGLLVFSREGRFLRTVGQAGDGPGEFRLITSLSRGPNDSIFAFDHWSQRVSVYDSALALVRTARVEKAGNPLILVSRLSDGAWVGREMDDFVDGPPYTLVRDTIAIGILDGSLGSFRAVGAFPGRMTTTSLVAGRRAFRAAPFSPEVAHTSWRRCVFISTSESNLVEVYTIEGRRLRSFRAPGRLRPISDEHLQRRLTFDLQAATEAEAPVVRRLLENEARPEHLPFYHRAISDQWGRVWLQEYEPPWGLSRRWYVVSQSGMTLADVEMPEAMRVFSIDQRGILGRALGPFDEELVEFWPWLGRPPPAPEPLSECIDQ